MTAVVIVEDFPPVARSLARQVADLVPHAKITIFSDMERARRCLEGEETDVLLLDLNLKGKDGFDLLRDCASRAFHTIVVSANTDRALEAFEYGVLDFVAKPVARERLQKALGRMAGVAAADRPTPRFFSVRRLGQVELIETEAVDYIQGAGKYSELVLKDGRTVIHDKSLERLSVVLAPAYWRIHKSYLVDLTHVRKLEVLGGGKYRAVLHSGARLPVGRSRYPDLAARFV